MQSLHLQVAVGGYRHQGSTRVGRRGQRLSQQCSGTAATHTAAEQIDQVHHAAHRRAQAVQPSHPAPPEEQPLDPTAAHIASKAAAATAAAAKPRGLLLLL